MDVAVCMRYSDHSRDEQASELRGVAPKARRHRGGLQKTIGIFFFGSNVRVGPTQLKHDQLFVCIGLKCLLKGCLKLFTFPISMT